MLQIRSRSRKKWLQEIQTIALLAALFLLNVSYADQVISCHDGDTCTVQKGNEFFKVRLYGVDAPEGDQPYGKESRLGLLKIVEGKDLDIQCHGKSYDRRTCDIFMNGKDVSLLMVEQGLAWDYPEFSHGKYQEAQKKAQGSKIGLWSIPTSQSPYCWRWAGVGECVKANNRFQP